MPTKAWLEELLFSYTRYAVFGRRFQIFLARLDRFHDTLSVTFQRLLEAI